MTGSDQRAHRDRPVGFRTLPAKDFPFTIEWWLEGSHEVVYGLSLLGPGEIQVPALSKIYHESVGVTVTYGDGRQIVQRPIDEATARAHLKEMEGHG